MGIYIVGIDGSETAKRAARRAADLAAASGGELVIVCAYTEPKGVYTAIDSPSGTAASAAIAAQEIVQDQAEEFRAGGIRATPVVAEGKPGQVILAEAERRGADVIVVGNRRMQGIGRILGSVANEVAHHAPCDVLIVKTV